MVHFLPQHGDLYIFLSTFHGGALHGETVRRTNPDRSSSDVPCPSLLPDCQQYMRGVDRSDQHIGYYNGGRRSQKWWKRVFAHLIECALYNAYLLERYSNPSLYIPRWKRSYLSFHIDVANQLIGPYHFRLRAGGQRSADSDTRLNPTLGHWPIQDTKKLECTVCTTTREKRNLTRKDLRHETRIKCSYCKVHLCINNDRNCFKLYHINKGSGNIIRQIPTPMTLSNYLNIVVLYLILCFITNKYSVLVYYFVYTNTL